MNTAAIEQAVKKLDELTPFYPINQLFSELQVVIERLSFLVKTEDLKKLDKNAKSQLKFLLEDDISNGLLKFAQYLADNQLLGLLRGELGEQFLRYVQDYFIEIPELKFKTAVDINDSLKAEISGKLKQIHPQNTRVVFEIAPKVMAGFMIEVSDGESYDYSLGSKSISYIRAYLKTELGNSRVE